jgi:hypothetical protein
MASPFYRHCLLVPSRLMALSDRRASRYHGRYRGKSGHETRAAKTSLLTDAVGKVLLHR